MEIYNLQLIECVCVENCSFDRESAALRLPRQVEVGQVRRLFGGA